LTFIKEVLTDKTKRAHYDRFGEKDLEEADDIEGSEAEEANEDEELEGLDGDEDEEVDLQELFKSLTGKQMPRSAFEKLKKATGGKCYNPSSNPIWTEETVESEWKIAQEALAPRLNWDRKQIQKLDDKMIEKNEFTQGIEEFILSNNRLISLPNSLKLLTNLRYLDLKYNKLTAFPAVILKLPQLRELYLDNNLITKLPESLSALSKLKKLSLFGNKVKSIDDDCFAGMKALRLVDLECNPISQKPQSLLDLQSTVEGLEVRMLEPPPPKKKRNAPQKKSTPKKKSNLSKRKVPPKQTKNPSKRSKN